jgi:N6-adenosine-specific RNA methylase IME4
MFARRKTITVDESAYRTMPERFSTIYADPPWPERGGGQTVRGAQKHYTLMSIQQIAFIPVSDWAEPNAHLYMWVTNNYLPQGLTIMQTWGFRYITTITWLKNRMGLGQYYRGMTEHCLFGVRGRLPYRTMPDGKRAQGVTGFVADRTSHSTKPINMRHMIERVSPGPYLELFGRRPVEGWTVWGNEGVGCGRLPPVK